MSTSPRLSFWQERQPHGTFEFGAVPHSPPPSAPLHPCLFCTHFEFPESTLSFPFHLQRPLSDGDTVQAPSPGPLCCVWKDTIQVSTSIQPLICSQIKEMQCLLPLKHGCEAGEARLGVAHQPSLTSPVTTAGRGQSHKVYLTLVGAQRGASVSVPLSGLILQSLD